MVSGNRDNSHAVFDIAHLRSIVGQPGGLRNDARHLGSTSGPFALGRGVGHQAKEGSSELQGDPPSSFLFPSLSNSAHLPAKGSFCSGQWLVRRGTITKTVLCTKARTMTLDNAAEQQTPPT